MLTITLGGTSYDVQFPTSFADRDEIAGAWAGAKSIRKSRPVYAATLALCVPGLGLEAMSLDEADGDIQAIGAPAYEQLRARGLTPKEISEAARSCFDAMKVDLYPRATEVEKKEDFSEAGEPQT